MTTANPPAVASWLLERLSIAESREALSGDLLEELHHGRTAAWYWRQVLSAISIGMSLRFRSRWTAIFFAAIWSALSPSLLLLQVRKLETDQFMERIRQLDSPWFTVTRVGLEIGMFFTTLWLGLGLYVALYAWRRKRLHFFRLLRGLIMTISLFLRLSMVMAAVLLLLAMAFPQISIAYDMQHATFGESILRTLFSPGSLLFFMTMAPSICASLPPRQLQR